MDDMTRTVSLVVDDLNAEITRLRYAGPALRSNVVAGPCGRQILRADPAGNLIELVQPAHRPTSPAEPA